jgi:aspartate carbamoyltransferase catalytic subunit
MIKNFVSTVTLDNSQAMKLIHLAESIKAQAGDPSIRKLLEHKTIANVFYEDSTRTRVSFELAGKRLGADVINFSSKGSSVSKGETFFDTIATLDAMAVDAFVLRSPESGAAEKLIDSKTTSATVINAGDGTNEHPTQALLDALTIREKFSLGANQDFTGLNVLITGDIKHSRVARSNAHLLSNLGAKVTLCAPFALLPETADRTDLVLTSDFEDALATKPDIVMMLRVQTERMTESLMPTREQYVSGYQLSAERAARLASHAIVMHPGPMIRELEIASIVADGNQSAIRQQVTNGVYARMAVLFSAIAQKDSIDG